MWWWRGYTQQPLFPSHTTRWYTVSVFCIYTIILISQQWWLWLVFLSGKTIISILVTKISLSLGELFWNSANPRHFSLEFLKMHFYILYSIPWWGIPCFIYSIFYTLFHYGDTIFNIFLHFIHFYYKKYYAMSGDSRTSCVAESRCPFILLKCKELHSQKSQNLIRCNFADFCLQVSSDLIW